MSAVRRLVLVSAVIGAGIGLAHGAMPVLITAAVPASETAAANRFNTLVRAIGISAASAVAGVVLAQMTTRFGPLAMPSQNGFRAVMAIGAGAPPWPSSRSSCPDAVPPPQLRRGPRRKPHPLRSRRELIRRRYGPAVTRGGGTALPVAGADPDAIHAVRSEDRGTGSGPAAPRLSESRPLPRRSGPLPGRRRTSRPRTLPDRAPLPLRGPVRGAIPAIRPSTRGLYRVADGADGRHALAGRVVDEAAGGTIAVAINAAIGQVYLDCLRLRALALIRGPMPAARLRAAGRDPRRAAAAGRRAARCPPRRRPSRTPACAPPARRTSRWRRPRRSGAACGSSGR